LKPSLDRVLRTENQRIDLGHATMMSELERLGRDESVPGRRDDGLVLIGRRDPRTNNSWLHNVPVGVKGRDRCTLLMHSADAKERELEDRQTVRIRSRVGEVVARLEVTDDILVGVVSLPHGWGHHRSGTRLRVAEAHPGVSLNDLTDDQWLEPVVGNAILNGIPVRVDGVD
jgi:anaerobic selenocysteine-containing dehydrogenase